MLNKLRLKLWKIFQKNPQLFMMKLFLGFTISGLILGLVFSAFFLLSDGTPFMENTGLFIVLSSLILVFVAAGSFFSIRILMRRQLKTDFGKIELPDVSRRQLDPIIKKANLADLEGRFIRLMAEEQITAENNARSRSLAAEKYGFWVSQEQLDKILEDENFSALKGKSRETVVVALYLHGASKFLLEGEMASTHGLFQKLFKKYVLLAKSSNLLLGEFSPDLSLLYADIPYATNEDNNNKLIGQLQKWEKTVNKLLAKEGGPQEFACLVDYGSVSAGKILIDAEDSYITIGTTISRLTRCIRENNPTGIWIADGYREHYPEAFTKKELTFRAHGWHSI